MNQFLHKRVFADIPIFSYKTVTSTQDIAKEMMDSSVDPLNLGKSNHEPGEIIGVISARHQSQGKGRRERSWESQEGCSMLCSYVVKGSALNPWIAVAQLMVANTQILRDQSAEVFLKWPNDIVVESGKKLGGCLTEIIGEFLCVGIGLNLKKGSYRSELHKRAVSLELLGIEVDPELFLNSVLERYNSLTSVMGEYRLLSHTLGKKIQVEQLDQSFEAIAIDINDDGSLLVELENGVRQSIFEGDIIHAQSTI